MFDVSEFNRNDDNGSWLQNLDEKAGSGNHNIPIQIYGVAHFAREVKIKIPLLVKMTIFGFRSLRLDFLKHAPSSQLRIESILALLGSIPISKGIILVQNIDF